MAQPPLRPASLPSRLAELTKMDAADPAAATALLPTVYLAGPDVFHPASKEIGARLGGLCATHGLRALYPADSAVPLDAPDAAARIYAADVAMINACAAVIANVTPWRGPNMDPGTAFEIGYAAARGTPIFIYTEGLVAWAEADQWRALDEKVFPKAGEFGHAENLMCCVPAKGIVKTAEEAIVMASDYLLRVNPHVHQVFQ